MIVVQGHCVNDILTPELYLYDLSFAHGENEAQRDE